MSEFKVNLATLKSQVSSLKTIGIDMTQIVVELENVIKNFSIDMSGIEKIKSDLSTAIAHTHKLTIVYFLHVVLYSVHTVLPNTLNYPYVSSLIS